MIRSLFLAFLAIAGISLFAAEADARPARGGRGAVVVRGGGRRAPAVAIRGGGRRAPAVVVRGGGRRAPAVIVAPRRRAPAVIVAPVRRAPVRRAPVIIVP